MLRRFRTLALLATFTIVPLAQAKPIPNLKFRDLAGHDQRLDSLRGSITVISFWATWCTPCRAELPRLSKLSEQYRANGVRFIAISVDESKDFAKIEPFLHQQNITLDIWTGADLDTLDRLAIGNIVPATIVLDKNGEIIGRISGEARDADVTGYLDWLLHDRQGTGPDPFIKHL
jgi:thiol-disulfide isomerase/thioredoxin